jgi:anti-sigma regulatory factor (Ser/Thr protein kinase)
MTGDLDTLEMRPDPGELARMREFVRTRAIQDGLPESERFQAQLVATEAVTNAIRHGLHEDGQQRPILVRCRTGEDGFTVEVGDKGRFRHREPSTPEDTSGRGLGLIERFTRGFDLETSEQGTTLRMLVGGVA